MGKPGSKACKHLPPKGFSCYLEIRIRELFTAAWFPLSEAKSLNAFFEANGLMTHTNSQLLILHLSFYIKHDRVFFVFNSFFLSATYQFYTTGVMESHTGSEEEFDPAEENFCKYIEEEKKGWVCSAF